ncbi:MAG TPA: penicillin-binding transpeptidase domain-containing protein, partial [Mycobacteriales bacterium]|nr:penicillin-binding transpeptidase domain-containing protein [Mycobacteriales bacterium]
MVYRRPGQRRGRRGRVVPISFAVLGVVVVLGAVFGVLHVRDQQRKSRERSHAEATAVAGRYLTAWGHGDVATMAANATPDSAAALRQQVGTVLTDLHISSATYLPGILRFQGDATAPFHASVVVQGLGTWSYDGSLVLHRVDKHWKVAFTPESIYPELHAGDTLVRERKLGTRGQIRLADGRPLRGLDGELDGNMLGTVGPYTAALAKSAGPQFVAGDIGGLTGLERGYNAVLSGTPGGSLTLRSSTGAILDTLISQPVRNGKDVTVSFDLNVQHAAESALSGVPANLTGSLVAIDVTTGKVLAVANHPYNGYGRAIRGHYPPGSTFKIITTTAALLSGKSASTPLPCTPSITVGGRSFTNAEGESYGTISLATAFAKSCNTAFISLETSLPKGALGRAAALFGFSDKPAGTDTATSGPLPLTSFGGSVPPPTDATDGAAEAIGQGRIVTSPLQMASVAAAVASGTWRQPYVSATAPANNPQHAIPANVVATLRDLMGQVVSYGTAAHSGLPAGTRGKTGTAEVGTKNPPDTVAWFVGYRGTIAFACQVGDSGAS